MTAPAPARERHHSVGTMSPNRPKAAAIRATPEINHKRPVRVPRKDFSRPRRERSQDWPIGMGHQASHFGLGRPPVGLKLPPDYAAVISP